MKNEVQPLRVLLKAIILFVVFNLIFAVVNPQVGKLTFYNYMIPGRLRFPYEQEPSFYLVGYNAPIYEDFDAMFGAHIISSRKPPNEFRLVLLGDSATWGISVQAGDTLSEQINELHIQACDGRNVRAYNLGYPMPFLMRDVMILDKAMEYQPDMVLWLITLSTLEPKTAETYFILPHAERYLRLSNAHGLALPHLAQPIEKAAFWKRTIIGQRRRLKNIVLTQAFGIPWAATGIDNHEGLQPPTKPPDPDVSGQLDYDGLPPEESQQHLDSLMLDVLSAGFGIAGDVPIVLVNEPIFLAEGRNRHIRYNAMYPRWMYDAYRDFISEWAGKENRPLLDYWNALSPAGFSGQNFHRSSLGEARLAELLAPEIKKLVCH